MNDSESSQWTQHYAGDEFPDFGGDHDFSSFLNFPDLSPPYDSGNGDGSGEVCESTAMETDFLGDLHVNGDAPHSTAGEVASSQALGTSDDMLDIHFSELHEQQPDQQHFLAHGEQQHGMQHNGIIVPPTPTSMELHGRVALQEGYPPVDTRTNMPMERYNTYREEQALFTPLVSPAVTPLDTEFSHNIPDFTRMGVFSPLASPALEAHHHRAHMPNPHVVHNPPPQQQPQPESPALTQKAGGRRKSSTSISSRSAARVVRESPSMKPQRKKAPPAFAATPEVITTLAQQAHISAPPTPMKEKTSYMPSNGNTPTQNASRAESSNESVSPEPLPEVLMAPPPPPSRPSSSSKSPPRGFNGTSGPVSAPVTPASLMNLQNPNLPTEDIPPISMNMQDYLQRDVRQVPNPGAQNPRDEQSTPTLPPRTPSSTSTLNSRQPSPASKSKSKKAEPKPTGRGKRASVSASSPALQPRISPSIKPILPGGMTSDASAHILLASKSNYQNIVEGNHSQLGLSYPEHLSTNLTSKRTSHKLAEQGRRHRINNALAEIAALLPASSAEKAAGEEKSAGGSGGTTQAQREQASKAAVVESAIEYIKELKGRNEQLEDELRRAKDDLEKARAILKQTKGLEEKEKAKMTEAPSASPASV